MYGMSQELDFQSLKSKHRRIREGLPEHVNLRIHRALSWIECAGNSSEGEDTRFISLWIAFNAAYADADHSRDMTSRREFRIYFDKLVRLDDGRKRIENALWEKFSGPVRVLMDNKYVFKPFWQHHNGVRESGDWREKFQRQRRTFNGAFGNQNTAIVLMFIFQRLYVLRNQIIHGGSTWEGRVNRDQVRDGAAILDFLVPVFVDIMMDNPGEDWGRPFYPVVE